MKAKFAVFKFLYSLHAPRPVLWGGPLGDLLGWTDAVPAGVGQQLFVQINNMADQIGPLVSFTTITRFRGIISCLVLSVAYVASLYVLKSPYPR